MSLFKKIRKYLIPTTIYLTIFFFPKTVLSAERLVFSLPILGDFTISVNSLEDFAKEGKINPDFAYYAKYLDDETLAELKTILQKKFEYDSVTVSRLTNTGMGETFLKQLGNIIQGDRNTNSFYGLRSSLILAAASEEGLTLVNILRLFPSQDIRLNTDILAQLVDEFSILDDYKNSAIQAIAIQAENEIKSEEKLDFSKLDDLSQKGPYQIIKKTLNLEIDNVRPTNLGIKSKYNLETDLYLPQNINKKIPLIVISHGFGSFKGKNDLPQYLASYGFAVAIPEHIGSDLKYRQSLLNGEIRSDISPMEYLSRPEDITYLIDELQELTENDSQWQEKIDFENVGVTGNSLGGTTSLSLAGAEINYLRLKSECARGNVFFNVSLLLQCRASYLPAINYNLKDDRIKAVAVSNPLISAIFGPEGLSKIPIPTLILGGSEDIITPVVAEQIHPFIWLNTPNKYLSLLVPGTHFTANLQSKEGTESIPQVLVGDNYEEGRNYFYGLALAFFETYLNKNKDYLPYLSASYAQEISDDKLTVYQINNLTPEMLVTAYKNEPPKPIIPKPIVEKITPRQETILTEIKRTRVLKVGITTDAIPFGYIDKEKHTLNGYCNDLISDFATNLQAKLNLNTDIEIIKIYSNIDNRYQLVRDKIIHFECGANSIRSDVKGITFSQPFFVTGTNLLTPKNQASTINPNQSLAGLKIGVLKNTTTETFMKTKYPQADLIFFEGENAMEKSLAALTKNEVNAIANDGILLLGEMINNDLSKDNYSIIPKQPLSCEFYGLILPENDPEWVKTINTYIDSASSNQTWDQWFTKLFPYVLSNLDYCLK